MRPMLALLAAAAAVLSGPQTPPVANDAAALLASASRWTEEFERNLSGLIFRERYLQQAATSVMGRDGVVNRTEMRLEANVFLLRPEGAPGFVLYRDVYRAADRDITDHTTRLHALLTEGTADAIAQARRLTDESTRHNLGGVTRNTNIPTMVLEYLRPAHVAALRARIDGRATIDGLRVIVVEFEETGRPTLVRANGHDVPAKGKYWIDPVTGAVLRAVIALSPERATGELDVRFERHPTLNVWVPAEMKEEWQSAGVNSSGVARYDRFGRLAVSTREIVK